MFLLIIVVNVSFSYIEKYYYTKTINSAEILIKDLNNYYNEYNIFPEKLSRIYPEGEIPTYKIGLKTYHFEYLKVDSSCKIFFSFFGGKKFCNSGLTKYWTVCD